MAVTACFTAVDCSVQQINFAGETSQSFVLV